MAKLSRMLQEGWSAWESGFFARSGFYTNRIRYGRTLTSFNEPGFAAQPRKTDRWEKLAISKHALASEFSEVPDDDLLVSGFDVLHSVRE